MKKLLVLLCLGALTFSAAACGKKDDGFAESTEQTTQAPATEETTAPTDMGTGENGGETAGTEGDMPAQGESWSEEMTAVRQAVVDGLGENYWPTMAVTPEMLEGTFGITTDMYEDYMGEMPMMSTHVDTLLIIRAKSDKVDEVEEALNTYRDYLINDSMQYPMNIGKVNASRIEKIGDYVCFVQLGGDTTEASEKGEEAVITHCQEQNELAIELISQSVEH